MVYSSKFVMAILVNGEPQQELANGVVPIPFGSEYTLRFRNKNDRRAAVKFFIDGENVSGLGYVVPANGVTDIKRHHDVDRAFQFVSLESGEAIEFGKNGSNDDKMKGVIEARFYFEKELPKPPQVVHHYHEYFPRPSPWRTPLPYAQTYNGDYGMHGLVEKGGIGGPERGPILGLNVSYGQEECRSIDQDRSRVLRSKSLPKGIAKTPELEDGCTVEGSVTGQYWNSTHMELETDYVVLKVFLQGFTPEAVPVVVKPKHRPTSGKLHELDLERVRLREELLELENKLAKLENEKLKKKLEELEKSS